MLGGSFLSNKWNNHIDARSVDILIFKALWLDAMNSVDRITFVPGVTGGKPCIRGMRVTAGMIVGLVAEGRTRDEILGLYPYLESEDIRQALARLLQNPSGCFQESIQNSEVRSQNVYKMSFTKGF